MTAKCGVILKLAVGGGEHHKFDVCPMVPTCCTCKCAASVRTIHFVAWQFKIVCYAVVHMTTIMTENKN